MERTNFENLRVYQLAECLADAVWDSVARWAVFARDTVGKQLVRTADSICANAAEETGRGSDADNGRFVRIARGSLHETRNWLLRAFRRNLFTCEQVESLKQYLDELTLTLNGYLRSLSTKH
jgi:four helix bundle protein